MKLTSKERATLRALASKIEPTYIIGKGNVTDNVVKGIDEVLTKRELVKISVLKTADKKAKDLIDDLALALDAVPVAVIGNKIVLYRYSYAKDVVHVEF